MAESFISLPVSLLQKHIPNYDIRNHNKLLYAYRRIAATKAKCSESTSDIPIASSNSDPVTIPADFSSFTENNPLSKKSEVRPPETHKTLPKLMPLPWR